MHFLAQFNLKPDNDASECIQYLGGDDPVVSKALWYVVAMLRKPVGYVNCPGLALMRGVEALRDGTIKRERAGKRAEGWGEIKIEIGLEKNMPLIKSTSITCFCQVSCQILNFRFFSETNFKNENDQVSHSSNLNQ